MFGKLLLSVLILTVAISAASYASPSLTQTVNTITQVTANPVTTSYALQTQTIVVSQFTSMVSSISSATGGLVNIPGFSIESILLGVALAMVFLLAKRSKKQ